MQVTRRQGRFAPDNFVEHSWEEERAARAAEGAGSPVDERVGEEEDEDPDEGEGEDEGDEGDDEDDSEEDESMDTTRSGPRVVTAADGPTPAGASRTGEIRIEQIVQAEMPQTVQPEATRTTAIDFRRQVVSALHPMQSVFAAQSSSSSSSV